MHKFKEFLDQLINVRASTTTVFHDISQPSVNMEKKAAEWHQSTDQKCCGNALCAEDSYETH
jgi:hypothetical protein